MKKESNYQKNRRARGGVLGGKEEYSEGIGGAWNEIYKRQSRLRSANRD